MNSGRSFSVELLLGPYRCGKTSLLIDQLLTLKQQNQLARILVLVPSARYGRLLKERLSYKLRQSVGADHKEEPAKIAGIFGLEIQPFYQCCLKILSQAGTVPCLIPEEIRPALLNSLLQQMHELKELSTLANIAEFSGTGVSVLELIDELERAGLTPEEVILRLESASCQESHLLELARIYARYWQRLQELDYFDQKSLALKTCQELFAGDNIEYDLVLIDGFDRISRLQALVFAGLARHARRTEIAFDYILTQESPAENPPLAAERSYSPAPESALSQCVQDYRWKDSSYNELVRHLGPDLHVHNLYAHGSEKLPGTGVSKISTRTLPEVEAVSLLDPFLEMVEVCRQIKMSLAQRQVLPEEIIVVARSPESYNGAIETAFEDAGIAYFIDGSRHVKDLEPWRFIRDLFQLAQNEFKRKDLIDILLSPFLNLEALGLTALDVSRLDSCSYDAGLIGGEKQWRRFLSCREYKSIAPGLLELFAALMDDSACSLPKEQARRLEDLLDKYMVLPSSDHNIRSAGAGHERESVKALRRCLKILIWQDSLLAEPPASFWQFFQRLKSYMEKASYACPRPQARAVTICAPELMPNKLFKEVYICGMVEGNFPKHQISAGLLSPEQIRLWSGFGIEIQKPRQEPGFERALFYSLTERACERLFLSLPQFDSLVAETLVSSYLGELSRKTGLTCDKISPFARSLNKPVSVRETISAALFQKGPNGRALLDAAPAAVSRRWQELEPALAALQARVQGQRDNLFNGYLKDFFAAGALSLPGEHVWTASKINDYGKCPFRFWATHVLLLAPRQENEAGLNPALIGLFYHKALEIFFSALSRKAETQKAAGREVPARAKLEHCLPADDSTDEPSGCPRPDSSVNDLIDTAFQEALAWLEAKAEFQPGAHFEQEKKELHFRLERFIKKELLRLENAGEYFPVFFEVSFGRNTPGSYPALEIHSDDGNSIFVRGTIDRIDLSASGDRACIIDYKSGTRPITLDDANRGRNLQLPVYALAFEQCFRNGASVDRADYLSVNGARSVGRLEFYAEKHAHLKEQARRFLQDYTQAVRSGIFTVSPNGRDVCQDCRQAASCRIAELQAYMTEDTDASFD